MSSRIIKHCLSHNTLLVTMTANENMKVAIILLLSRKQVTRYLWDIYW